MSYVVFITFVCDFPKNKAGGAVRPGLLAPDFRGKLLIGTIRPGDIFDCPAELIQNASVQFASVLSLQLFIEFLRICLLHLLGILDSKRIKISSCNWANVTKSLQALQGL